MSNNNAIQSLPCSDLTLAKIRFKLNNTAGDFGINEYQEDCVDVIFDYTIIFMKSLIRSMARHKRKYKVVCPILTGKSEKNENSPTKKESSEEKLWPWQVKINWEVVREENIKFLDANDFKDVEEKDSQRDEGFDREAWFTELLKSRENPDIDASYLKRRSVAALKTIDDSSSSVDKRTKSSNNKRLCEEYTEKTVKKKTNECAISEIVYSPDKFHLRDLRELLKMDVHVIPLRSVCEIFQANLEEKLGQKIRF